MTSNILIVGAGPAGITTACLIKLLHSDAQITVVDKRETCVRNHGLRIDTDPMDRILAVLKRQLKVTQEPEKQAAIREFQQLFTDWRGHVRRTSEVEMILAEKAQKLGITILRGKEHAIDQLEGHPLYCQAQVVIGAEGSHSPIRAHLLQGAELATSNLGYLAEFKFEIAAHAKPRGYGQAIWMGLKAGTLQFETMGGVQTDVESKPGTLHVRISEAVFKALHAQDAQGKVRGEFATPWSLEELERNPEVAELLAQYACYSEQRKAEGVNCTKVKVTVLPTLIYESPVVALQREGKSIVLVGDASSGVAFGRGVNKAFHEAALAAEAVADALKKTSVEGQLPKPLQKYREKHHKLYVSERRWAVLKGCALDAVQWLLGIVRVFRRAIAALSARHEVKLQLAFP